VCPSFGGDAQRRWRSRRPDEVGVVVPWTRSNRNTLDNALHRERNLDADAAGILAILDDLERRLGARPRVVLTGFSGGGQVVYRMTVRHPDRLVAAVPVCPNFNYLAHGYRERAGDGSLPVRIVTGEADPLATFCFGGWRLVVGVAALILLALWRWRGWPLVVLVVALIANHLAGIEYQARTAESVLKGIGYDNVRRKVMAGRGHEPMPELVFEVERGVSEGHDDAVRPPGRWLPAAR
jgi:pimeloyl-ACP methyl ester carboxylesterase